MPAQDFVVHPAQVFEARAAGADTLLLIVAILTAQELSELIELSRSLGMEPLVEAANESEMLAAVQAGARVIGVNNRDLRSFKVDLGTTARLISHARTNSEVCATQPVFVLSLSGIRGGQDVASVASQCSPPHPSQANGVHLAGILVGEALMKASDPAALVREMREAFAAGGWGSSSTLTLGGLVKVCGLTNKEDALHAARAGAHMLGFIRVPGSRRCVDVAVTQGIVDAVRAYREQDPAADLQRGMGAALQAAQASSETSSLSREGLLASANSKAACAWFNAFWREGLQPAATRAPPLTVGVYQNMPMQEVAADAAACGFDIVQLHGDEAADAALHLPEGLPAIRVVHLPPSTADCADPSGSAGTCAAVLPHVVPGGAAVLLIDARRAGQQGGGTGAAVDWLGLGELPSALAASGTGHAALPFIVAGGVTAHNVQQAVTESGATGVDVSSGVEASGHGTAPRKDPASVTAYVSSAKKALASTLAKGDNPQEQGEDCSAAAAAADGASAPPTS